MASLHTAPGYFIVQFFGIESARHFTLRAMGDERVFAPLKRDDADYGLLFLQGQRAPTCWEISWLAAQRDGRVGFFALSEARAPPLDLDTVFGGESVAGVAGVDMRWRWNDKTAAGGMRVEKEAPFTEPVVDFVSGRNAQDALLSLPSYCAGAAASAAPDSIMGILENLDVRRHFLVVVLVWGAPTKNNTRALGQPTAPALEAHVLVRFEPLPARVPRYMLGPLRVWLHTALQTTERLPEARVLELWQRLSVQHPIAIVSEAQFRETANSIIFLDAVARAHRTSDLARAPLELTLLSPVERDVEAAPEASVLTLLARFVPELRRARRETVLVVRRLTMGVVEFCAKHRVPLAARRAQPALDGGPGVWAPFERVGPPRCDAAQCKTDPTRTVDPKRCARCQTAYYCGAACQQRAWAEHKEFCAAVAGARVDPGRAERGGGGGTAV